MVKPICIKEIKPYSISLVFSTGEIKELNLLPIFNNAPKYVNKEKLFDKDFFLTAKIGELGQLYWNNAAYMIEANDSLTPCEFDISPEFLYANASSIKHHD